MSPPPNARPHDQARQGQVVSTFGPGSMLDLPKHSILVGGLEMWTGVGDLIHEPRLIEKLKKLLEVSDLKLYSPPAEGDDPTRPKTGITGWQFPEWFIVQDIEQDKR